MGITSSLSGIFVQTLEQAIDGVVVIDADNNVVLFNPAAERLWALSPEQVLGHNVNVLIPHDIRPHHDAYVNHNRVTGIDKYVGVSRDVPIMRGDGGQRWGAMSISRIVSDGQILYTAFIKDVTEQHAERERLRLLSLVTDQTDSSIIITDSQWRIVYVNAGFQSMFGYSLDEVRGQFPDTLLAPHLSREVRDGARELLSIGQPIKAEELTYVKSGERIWCSVTINPIRDSAGLITNAVGILTDISRSKMHEVLQHRMLSAMVREEPLETLMELACREIERIAPDVITSVLQIDEQDRLHTLAAPRLSSDYCRQIDGLKIGEGVGSCGTAAFRGKPVISTDIANDPLWRDYKSVVLPLGLKSCWSTPIMSTEGRAIGTLALYYKDVRGPSAFHQQLVDVIVPLCALALEREKIRAHISQLAFYDSLTELPNRSLLHANAEHALSDAKRNNTELAVLFIDLDRFKQVNDSMGHPAGDELLQVVAKRLCFERRQNDIVARLSGDEFVMILPKCGSRHVTDVVEHLKLTLGEPCRIAGKTLSPSASIGISVFPDDGDNMGVLIHRADMAMYQAKKAGRGRFSFFSHELNQKAQERQALEQALREALSCNQFRLHYQPQVDMQGRTLHGVEALARWTHPQFGEISPVRFIPLAEECGLIGDLGLWAIREACRQLAAWRSKGLVVPMISVNLSPTNFHNIELPGMIARTLEHYRLAASDLTLELTENVLMDIHPSTLNVLNEVHALGVGLAMDDFGTGYSSLSYLRRLPIRELKLDRSFVMDLENDPTSQALSDAVIHIGESLSLKVVAEGIETEAQYQILKRQGYHVAQGYLFSRPLSASDLEVWLTARAQQAI
jgi:diguanylate cyclase (GGDEF)-like protein/PAS domain S-box-containing protein